MKAEDRAFTPDPSPWGTRAPGRATSLAAAINRRVTCGFIVSAVLVLAPLKRGRAEERVDLKALYYQESDGRIQVIAPSAQMEKALSSDTTIKIDGVYNAISGATPTGAPPPDSLTTREVVVVPAPAADGGPGLPAFREPEADYAAQERNDDDDEESEDGVRRVGRASGARPVLPRYHALGAATPTATPAPAPQPTSSAPAPSSGGGSTGGGGGATTTRSVTETKPGTEVPKQDIEDTRVGANVELIKRLGRHTAAGMVSFSTESDYNSMGLALRDSIDFNQKNTTLLVGGAATFDEIEAYFLPEPQDKTSYDVILGLTQILDPKTLVTFNMALGVVDGYLDDPYKVAEVDGVLVPEHRPDSKSKQVYYVALTRYLESLRGSAEVAYRMYDDDFGITGNTLNLAWYQKIGNDFILRPAIRYYTQTEADFYDVRFTGSPEYFSSDYRISEFDALGYGLKLIWKTNERVWFDVAYERYSQEGQDGITVQDAYPQANYFIMGCRIWL